MTHQSLYTVYIASCEETGGIYRYNLAEGGCLAFQEKMDLDSPMYLAIHQDNLYALLRAPFDHSLESGLVSFEVSADGSLIKKGGVISTLGQIACHLTIDDEVYCVNYTSGSVFKTPDRLVAHTGKSVDPSRQEGPHPHNVIFTPDKKYVCVVDLGLDKILVYDKELNLVSSAEVPLGHGPRHMVFSPDGKTAFCANELKSTVTVFSYQDGALEAKDTFPTLPDDYSGENTVAAIRISSDGKFLYVSNRGHDSLSCFHIDGAQLVLFDIVPCGGKTPWDFNLSPDEKILICTNWNSNNVTVFDMVDGRPVKTGVEVQIGKPQCVIFNVTHKKSLTSKPTLLMK